MTLSGANTYSGKTTVTRGVLEVSTIGNWSSVNSTATNLGSPTTASAGRIEIGTTTAGATAALRYVGDGETTNRPIYLGVANGGGAWSTTVDSSGSGPLVFTSDTTNYYNGTSANCTLTLTGANTDRNVIQGTITSKTPGTMQVTGLIKAGDGTWVLKNSANSYSKGTTISAGTLIVEGNASVSDFSATGAFTSGSTTVTVTDGLSSLHVGDMLYGAFTTSSVKGCKISTIVGSTVTLDISANVTGTFTIENTGNSLGILGSSHGDIALGDAGTTTNNSSPSLIVGGQYTVAHPITIADRLTTGTYSLGGNTANTATFSGPVTMNQPLTFSQVSGGALNVTGGIATNDNALTFSGAGDIRVTTALTTAGNLTKNGAGTLTTDDIASNGVFTVNDGPVQVDSLTGTGTTVVHSSLTADSIVQNTLTIGAGGSVTIRETAGAASGTNVNAVPEPGLWVLLCAGAAFLLPLWRRARRA